MFARFDPRKMMLFTGLLAVPVLLLLTPGASQGFISGFGTAMERVNDAATAVTAQLPPNSVTISYGGVEYFYSDGVFFVRAPGGYLPTYPPAGIVVPQLPSSFRTIMSGGYTYYMQNGIYYLRVTDGYQVAPQPAPAPAPMVVAPAPVVVTPVPVVPVYPYYRVYNWDYGWPYYRHHPPRPFPGPFPGPGPGFRPGPGPGFRPGPGPGFRPGPGPGFRPGPGPGPGFRPPRRR